MTVMVYYRTLSSDGVSPRRVKSIDFRIQVKGILGPVRRDSVSRGKSTLPLSTVSRRLSSRSESVLGTTVWSRRGTQGGPLSPVEELFLKNKK